MRSWQGSVHAWQVMVWRLRAKGPAPQAARGRKIEPPAPLAVREREAAFVPSQGIWLMSSWNNSPVPQVARGSRERLVTVMARGVRAVPCACPVVEVTQVLPPMHQEVQAQAHRPVLSSRVRQDRLQKYRSTVPM